MGYVQEHTGKLSKSRGRPAKGKSQLSHLPTGTITFLFTDIDRADYDRGAAAVRVALGEVAEVRWAEGRAMSLDQALEHALSRAP